MKKLLLAVTMLSMASAARGGIGAYSELTDEDIEVCTRAENIAEQAMKARQSGESFMTLIKEAKSVEKDEWWLDIRMSIIHDIYDYRIQSIESSQDDAIRSYESYRGSACLISLIEHYKGQ